MREHRSADTKAERGIGGAHRLDLAMVGGEPLERAAAKQGAIIIAQREKADRRIAERVGRHDVAGRRRRPRGHFGKMLREQGAHVVAVELALMGGPVHRNSLGAESL